MLLLCLLAVYSAWFFVKAIRDPIAAFPWVIPLVAVTRSLRLPVLKERLVLFDVLLLLWLGLLLIQWLNGRARLSLPRDGILVLGSYGIFMAVAVFSLLDAPDVVGGVTLLAVYAFGPCIALASLLATRLAGGPRRLLTALVLTFCLVTFLGVLEVAGLPSPLESRHEYRVTSTFRSPNQLGSFLFILLPVAAGFLLSTEWRQRGVKIAVAGALAAAPFVLILTSSRTSLAVVVIEIGLFSLLAPLWLQKLEGKQKRRLLAILSTALIVIAIGLSAMRDSPHFLLFRSRVVAWSSYVVEAASFSDFVDRVSGKAYGQPFLLNTIMVPLRSIQQEPFLGIGVGNAGSVLEIWSGLEAEVHNQYLAIAAETGLLGALALVLFLSLIVLKMFGLVSSQPRDRWMAVGIGLAVIACLISGVYIRFLRRRALWILIGIILADLPLRRPTPKREVGA